MQKTETTEAATATYIVTIDATGARSIVAEYASYLDAYNRFSRAAATIETTGGSVALYGANGMEMKATK